jgi:hypothetical protein
MGHEAFGDKRADDACAQRLEVSAAHDASDVDRVEELAPMDEAGPAVAAVVEMRQNTRPSRGGEDVVEVWPELADDGRAFLTILHAVLLGAPARVR